MISADFYILAFAVFFLAMVVSVIRSEVKERRYHRDFMATIRRLQMHDQRNNPEGK